MLGVLACMNNLNLSCFQFKVWVKPGAEQSFLYGNHVLKSGLGRITENTMQYQGVVVYSMADVPLVSYTKCCVVAFSATSSNTEHNFVLIH